MSRDGPLKLKIMLFCGEVTAMGPGKAELLEAIDREGSISAGARAMGMSYRRAWMLVDTMNRCWTEPVVETVVGGGARGGARLTAFGRRLLNAYRELDARLMAAAADGPFHDFEQNLLARPRPAAASDPAHKDAESFS
jgi:molybdate transport system regulatory protein